MFTESYRMLGALQLDHLSFNIVEDGKHEVEMLKVNISQVDAVARRPQTLDGVHPLHSQTSELVQLHGVHLFYSWKAQVGSLGLERFPNHGTCLDQKAKFVNFEEKTVESFRSCADSSQYVLFDLLGNAGHLVVGFDPGKRESPRQPRRALVDDVQFRFVEAGKN